MKLCETARWADVVEASYAPMPDYETWAKELVVRSRAFFGGREVVGMTALLGHSPDCSAVENLAIGTVPGPVAEQMTRLLEARGFRALRALFYPPEMVTSHSEVEPALDAGVRDVLAMSRQAYGVSDCLGLTLHPMPGTAAVLYAGFERRVVFPRDVRRLLTQLALHIEAGLRVLLRPELVVAELTTDGRITHREAHVADDGGDLSSRVRLIEKARTRRHRGDPDMLALWPALTAGKLSIVERSDGARRRYLVVENRPETWPLRALSAGERDVVSYASRGLSSKLVAYALGVSTPTVSARLANAASKIGVASRSDLVRLAALFTRDPRAGSDALALTTAEREVLDLVTRGLSNGEIARMRNRSVRTIANQVAQLLRKTSSATRRGLVVYGAASQRDAGTVAIHPRRPASGSGRVGSGRTTK